MNWNSPVALEVARLRVRLQRGFALRRLQEVVEARRRSSPRPRLIAADHRIAGGRRGLAGCCGVLRTGTFGHSRPLPFARRTGGARGDWTGYGKRTVKFGRFPDSRCPAAATMPWEQERWRSDGRRHKRGGIYFEDFVVGAVIEHGLTRTVTQMDNMLFSNMTLNPQPLHIDAHFCATETEWGQPLMNSLFTLGLMIGISVNDTTVGTTIGNLGMTDVTFPAPLFEGDTINCVTEIVAKRESKSRPDAGHRRIPSPRLQAGRQAGGAMPRQAFMKKRPVGTVAGLMRSLLFVPGDSEKKLAEGPRERRRRADPRPRGFRRARCQAGAREIARAFLQAIPPEAAAADRARQRARHRPDRGRSRRRHARRARRDHAAEGRRRRRRLAISPRNRRARGRRPICRTAGPRSSSIATETGKGMFGLGSYAGASRASSGLTWGAEDLSADLGAETNRAWTDGTYTDPYRIARSLCLFGAVAAGRSRHRHGLHGDFRDDGRLTRECEEARRDGFTGKMAIHPAQVPVINEVFSPSGPAESLARAEAIIALFAANPGRRRGRARRRDARPAASGPRAAASRRARRSC
jgi:acyl dehydratase